MNGRWDRPDTPHKGWTLIGVEDLGECEATCEMCGKEEIRYLHQVGHAEHEDLFVGCVCAEKMTGDYVTPRRLERKLKAMAGRRAKWLGRAWRVSAHGNEYLNVHGLNVGVFPDRFRPGFWKWRVGGQFSADRYHTSDAAKIGLLDELIARLSNRNTRAPPRPAGSRPPRFRSPT